MVLSLQLIFESQMGSGEREVRCSGISPLKRMKWSDLLSSKDDFTQEALPFVPPGLVEGSKMMVFSDEEIAEDVHRCDDLVVGCFVGMRLPFLQVKNIVQRVWNLKGTFKMTLHGDCRTASKIDRVLINMEWLEMFHESNVEFLLPCISDHSPGIFSIFDGKQHGTCLGNGADTNLCT